MEGKQRDAGDQLRRNSDPLLHSTCPSLSDISAPRSKAGLLFGFGDLVPT